MIRALILIVFTTLIACKGVESIKQQAQILEDMKTELSALKDSLEVLKVKVDSLKVDYESHLDKFHRGGKAPSTQSKPTPPPRRVK